MSKEDVYVINLEKNPDKKKYIENTYNKIFNLQFINAVYDERPNKGCYLSHMECIKIAKENNLDYIIVMEDDCMPRFNKWKQNLDIILEYLKNNIDEWNVFLGGTTCVQKEDIINKFQYKNVDLYKLNKGNTTHFIIYNKNCYDYFLNHKFDGTSVDRIWHNKLIGLVSVPYIFKQKQGYSDIEKKYVMYSKSFLRTENILKNFN